MGIWYNSAICLNIDEERATKQSEVNLLMDEVEEAQTRLLSLEREKVTQLSYVLEKLSPFLNSICPTISL